MPGSWSQCMYTCHVVEQPYRHYSFWCALLAHKLFNTNKRSSECCEIVLEFAFDCSGSISYLLFLCFTNPPYSYSFYALQILLTLTLFMLYKHQIFPSLHVIYFIVQGMAGVIPEKKEMHKTFIFQYILGKFNLLKKNRVLNFCQNWYFRILCLLCLLMRRKWPVFEWYFKNWGSLQTLRCLFSGLESLWKKWQFGTKSWKVWELHCNDQHAICWRD